MTDFLVAAATLGLVSALAYVSVTQGSAAFAGPEEGRSPQPPARRASPVRRKARGW